MSTTISVNKQTIEQFLLNARTKPFIIPDYQRPYSWTSDQINTLFKDIWEFTCNEGGTDKEGTYFLGSIVFYENKKYYDCRAYVSCNRSICRYYYTDKQ